MEPVATVPGPKRAGGVQWADKAGGLSLQREEYDEGGGCEVACSICWWTSASVSLCPPHPLCASVCLSFSVHKMGK